MPLVPLKLPPGIQANGTAYQAKGRWRDCNFVRWNQGIMEPIGGWQRITETPFSGRVGGLWPFRDNRMYVHLAVGTNSHLYILSGGSYTDITPVGFTPGLAATSPGVGFGSGEYGAYTYGDARPEESSSISLVATTWSLDSWGEFLLALSSTDGKVYMWRPATDTEPAFTKALPIAEAPADNAGLVVTPERHLCLVGARGDPRLVQWSDREDYTTWDATATNLAGEIPVQTQGRLLRGIKVNQEILLLGDSDVFTMRYVGAPLAYGIDKAGSSCGAVGANAAAVANDFVAWMGVDGFYIYNGSVNPLPCEVRDWVYREFNDFQGALVSAGHNSRQSEIWWFFPIKGTPGNSRYVAWNYRDNTWTIGYLERAVFQEAGPWANQLAAGEDGHIYEHEISLSDELVEPRPSPYVESAPFDVAEGDRVVKVMRLVPDGDSLSLDTLRYEFKTRSNPRTSDVSYGPYFPDSDGFTDVRFSGKQVTMRVTAVKDKDWRLGVLRADMRAGGKR